MKQEEEGEEPQQDEPLFLPSSQLTQQEVELVKRETANMTEQELAEILRFDDDELEEFGVSEYKNEDTDMEDVSEIAATQSDHSSGKVILFIAVPCNYSTFNRHSVHCLRIKQRRIMVQ